jgi:hypothetical protein
MRKNFAIATAFLLLNFVAFAQIPSDANLRIGVNNLSETNFSGTVSNTEPDIQYEIQRKQSVTNWTSIGCVYGSETRNWTPFDFKINGDVTPKTVLRVRSWKDDGSGLPMWWQLKYFGDTGIDPYGNPMGDGWSNLQKMQNGMNPFTWYEPPKPVFDVKFYGGGSNPQKGAVLTWQCQYGTIPDYFLIERAKRTLRPMTNALPFMRPSPYGGNGRFPTNRPPGFRPPHGPPGFQREDPLITGPFELIARIPGQPGVREYRYVETNADTMFQPIYHLQPHYSPPPQIQLTQVNAAAIRKTILSVITKQTTNGYDLTAMHPIAYGSYLLLVRDKNDPQWRASGYFSAGTNRNPVYLHVDAKGMMSDGQSPIAMPAVNFLPDVVKPEFTAGWGKDSDGDGLPDIYEVLVTHTEPDNADTGDTGILDGDKEMTGDGWSNWEKFRCRVDPLKMAHPPATVEFKQPTGIEIMQAITPKIDLGCELQIEVRTNGATDYQPIEKVPWMFYKIVNFRQPNDHRDFDVRVSWRFAHAQLRKENGHAYGGAPALFEAIEPLMEKLNLEMFNAFKADLETNPPLSPLEMSNKMAEVMCSYREGGMDKGIAMAEMMLLQNYQSQSFYGKVIDQDGKPLRDVSVNADITLNDGSYGGIGSKKYSTSTDSNGLFEFTGLHGAGLGVTISKPGYENEWRNDAYKGPDGGRSTLTDRTIYRMWSTNIHEALITGTKKFEIVPDGKPHFINLADGTISEHEGGDLKVWIQYTNHVVQGQLYDWSAGIEVVNGGLWEVPQAAMNSGFMDGFHIPMFSAPADGYVPSFSHNGQIKGGQSGEFGHRYFYLLLNGGKEYGKMGIDLIAPYGYLHPGLVCISYAINPSGSRILR